MTLNIKRTIDNQIVFRQVVLEFVTVIEVYDYGIHKENQKGDPECITCSICAFQSELKFHLPPYERRDLP